ELKPKQTRHLPTRLVSLSTPDPQAGLSLPGKGEVLQILGDITGINDNPRVQKALKRLAADKAPTTVAQLVMWRLAADLDWDTIAQLSAKWANSYELTLARDFVEHLGALTEGETGRILWEVHGSEAATEPLAALVRTAVQGKLVLGLLAELGIPARPAGPAVACQVRLTAGQAVIQIACSDRAARSWVPAGKFTLPLARDGGTFEGGRFADAVTEGILNRLVRAQLTKGPREKGKPTFQIRIDNASPLILNGLALVGTSSREGEEPKVLSGISIPPRKSLTVPASEEVVKLLGLKKGIRILALDLSGL
ncbi:MAG TPA: hypothetical protein VFF52_26880, partial [Isosphaeraceae bacterium]|nr:hypothetical protein [Isosphaeraceae bacterium]